MTVYTELARAIETCTSVPLREPDEPRPTTRQRFERFFAHHQALMQLAIAAGIAAHREGPTTLHVDPERVHIAVDLLWGGLDDGLSYIGYDEGYFYGGQPWAELCVVRSAVAMIEALCDARDTEASEYVDRILDHFSDEMFAPTDVPEGMPESHWWWRAPHPTPST